VIAPKPISNNPIELIKLNKGFVGVCNTKNSTAIASTALRLFATKNSKNEKIVFPHRTLNPAERDRIKANSKSLTVKRAYDVVEITEHPVFKVLNEVNDDLNYYDLMEMTSSYLGLTGNAFWEIVKDKKGLPERINILPSEYTTCLLTDDMHIYGYRLFNGIYKKEFKFMDVIHFKNTSPGLFWRVWNNALVTGLYGMGDLEYCLDEVYLYNSINDYLRALTENNAIPSAIIKYTGGRLDKNTMEDVQKQWDKMLRTWKRAGKTKVMDQDFDWVPISTPPKDLEFNDGRKWLRGVIANAFGVPIDLLTTEDSNKASSSTAIHAYMRYTILPKLRRMEERLNSHLISLYDDNLFFEFDTPVPNDEALSVKQENQDLLTGVLTINEVRIRRGMQPVEWGNVPFSPSKELIKVDEANAQVELPVELREPKEGNVATQDELDKY
jgi:HK97 family phage portal protein